MFDHFDIPSEKAAPFGLGPVKLRDLQQVVILAGKNGSGKSRYLRLVGNSHAVALQRHALQEQRKQPARRRTFPPSPDDQTAHHARIDAQLASLPYTALRMPSDSSLIHMDAKNLAAVQQQSIGQLTHTQFMDLTKLQPVFEMGAILTQLQHHLTGMAIALYQRKHPEHVNDEALRAKVEDVGRFNELCKALLDTELVDGHANASPFPMLFGRKFEPGELSPGQRTLLSWALALHYHSGGVALPKGALITIDEPELSLHPSAHVDILDRVYRQLIMGTTRQLWLATHSPSIVAHFADRADIYLVENNSMSKATRKLAVVMDDLLGGNDGRERLHTFLRDAASIEFCGFMAQCLSDALVSARSTDTQSNQMVTVLRSKINEGAAIKVLDYGSGKGRFAAAIAEISEADRAVIDYRTYDDKGHDHDRPERLKNVRALYPNEEDRERRCSNCITDYMHERTMDLVVMANFLHEIPAPEWFERFAHARDVLSTEGALLIFEDQKMPVGELGAAPFRRRQSTARSII